MKLIDILYENTHSPFIEAVRQYAMDHYNEDGWDYVVEAMEDEDISEDIAGATTPEEAIEMMRKIAKTLGDHRSEIEATAF